MIITEQTLSYNTLVNWEAVLRFGEHQGIEMFTGNSIKWFPIPLSTTVTTDVIHSWKLNKRRKHEAFSLLKEDEGL